QGQPVSPGRPQPGFGAPRDVERGDRWERGDRVDRGDRGGPPREERRVRHHDASPQVQVPQPRPMPPPQAQPPQVRQAPPQMAPPPQREMQAPRVREQRERPERGERQERGERSR
ncbi:MAG TPA: hypothetical protein VGD46_03590, partial [Rhizobacter sp.]